MIKVIAEIQELYKTLLQGNKDNVIIKEELTDRDVKLKEKEEKSNERAEDLNKREATVRVIEDVKALNEETRQAVELLKKDRGQLNIERKAFENYQAQEKESHAKLKASLESSMKVANEKEDKYNKLIAELEEKKKNLVKEVTEEILKKK